MRFKEFYDQQTDEMIGVKKYHNYRADELAKVIANDFGMTYLGRGALGQTIQTRDPEVVLKVFETDSAYLSFINYIMRHPNKHYPKVIRAPKQMTAFYKRYDIQPNQYTILALEKLYELPENMAAFIRDVANADDLYDKPDFLPNGELNGNNDSGYYDDDDEYGDNYTPSYTFNDLKRDYPWIPSLWEAAHAALHSKSVKGGRDLHAGNLMMRKDGTIVIIDPVVDSKGLDLKTAIADKDRSADPVPMIKGPRYKTQPTQSTPDPNAEPLDDTPLWSKDDGKTKQAFDEWKALFYNTSRTPEEEQRFNRLNAILDQKRKLKK